MITAQNYVSRGRITTLTPSINDERQNVGITDEYRESLNISQPEVYYWIKKLWDNGYLNDEQRDWSDVIPVVDDRMTPQLVIGTGLVATMVDNSAYKSLSGIIAVHINGQGFDKPMIGRVVTIKPTTIELSFDNKIYPNEIIKRRSISHICKVVFSLLAPVL